MNELDLETVRAKARELGVEFHPAMKAETVQAKIDAFLTASDPTLVKPEGETDAQKEAKQLQEAMALIPVTITSMDPADSSLTAVVVSVGNKKLGQVTKAIPFGFKWYMPKILIDELASKQFCRTSMVPVPGGTERVNTQWIKKYAIEYHPIPSPEELAELAKAQAIGNELAK